jgi:hypothetical protein
MPFDYAIHSDFLIHWTGKDIDESDPEWRKEPSSTIKEDSPCYEPYLKRLADILKYGLWLTVEDDQVIRWDGVDNPIPRTPKVCFTELKLSESRKHAREYGRLGIGVKRPYLFRRQGRPVAYYQSYKGELCDPFLGGCSKLQDKRLLSFFKPMSSPDKMDLKFYSESEWRILFDKSLLGQWIGNPKRKGLIDPSDKRNEEAYAFWNGLDPEKQERLKYLAPLDGWFAMIIYPSVDVKNAAQKDPHIREEIERIKSLDEDDEGNRVEKGNWPIEVDLDACRNF